MVLRGFKVPLSYTMEMAEVVSQYPLYVQKRIGYLACSMRDAAECAATSGYEHSRLPEDQTASFIPRLSEMCGLAIWCRSGPSISSLRNDWIEKCVFLTFQTADTHMFECLQQVFGIANFDLMCAGYEEVLEYAKGWDREAVNPQVAGFILGAADLVSLAKERSDIDSVHDGALRWNSQFDLEHNKDVARKGQFEVVVKEEETSRCSVHPEYSRNS